MLLQLLLMGKVRIRRVVGVGRVNVLRNGGWSILTLWRSPSLLRRVGVCSTRTPSFRLSRSRRRGRGRLLLLGRWRRRIVRTRSRPELRTLLLLGPVLMLRVILLLSIPQRCKLELIERRRRRRQGRHVRE